MGRVLTVIRREYLIRVQSKGFILGTILTPLLMSGLMFLPLFMARRSVQQSQIAVLDS
ncbi:MAG: ABC transporter permease, partial [Deltaproteobacteria bacterium]|nr:ABC transporter permease [Deltaproteobacteria bacterium]